MVIATRARDLGLSLEGGDVGRVNVGRIVAELGLPLIGPEFAGLSGDDRTGRRQMAA